jgi:hypothetical protein
MSNDVKVQQDDWSVDKLVGLAIATLAVVFTILYSISP